MLFSEKKMLSNSVFIIAKYTLYVNLFLKINYKYLENKLNLFNYCLLQGLIWSEIWSVMPCKVLRKKAVIK